MLRLVAPDDIDLAFVPRPIADVLEVVVDGEVLLVGPRDTPLVLNPTASLIWQCLDGTVSLEELSNDLSEELGVDLETVRTDVVEFTRSIGVTGLLDGVGIVAEPDPSSSAPAAPRAVGEEIEPFTLADHSGRRRSLTEWRGKRVLLMNWSPGCGYCAAIAPALAELRPHLADRDVDMLLVASGDAGANQVALESVGLDVTVLQKADEPDPFEGFGTPLAYLLDAEGRVATSAAWGAEQVLALGEAIAGITVTDNPFGPTPAGPAAERAATADRPDDGREVRYLPAPGGMCGPGGGGGPTTAWAGTVAVEVADWHIGVRHNGEFAVEALERVLPGAVVTDPRVPDNYSIALHPPSGAAAQELHLVVAGSAQVARTRSAARAVRALLTYIGADLRPPPVGLLGLRMAALVRDDRVFVVPRMVTQPLEQMQSRLGRAGFRVVDAPSVLLDAGAAELVVPEPAIPHDPAALVRLDAHTRLGRELPAVVPGRYPVRAVVLVANPDGDVPASPAQLVAALLPFAPAGADLRTVADLLTRLVGAADIMTVSAQTPVELLGAIRAE